MKNKKLVLIIFSILLCIAIYFLTNNIQKSQSSYPSIYTITSTENDKIEKDGFEVEQIQIIKNPSKLEVITKLNNNSNEAINGFFIEILLLDKEGKTVTSIVKNSPKKISAKQSIVFTNYVTGLKNMQNIESAKIESIEKN